MKRSISMKYRGFLCTLALVLALAAGLFFDGLALVSHAETAAKITATSAKIRKEASTTSEVLGSVAKGTAISIIEQVQGSDGYVWYKTYANATTTGYVRSDLVTITDGSTPGSAASNTAGSVSDAGVTKVNPISATVSGSSSVRIRNQASTSGKIVTTASNGLALTVTGTVNGTDGKVWYMVSYSSNGSAVEGFIRSDYVTLSGELTPFVEQAGPVEPEPEDIPTPETPVEDEPVVLPDFQAVNESGVWYLHDNTIGEKHDILNLFDKVNTNAEAYKKVSAKLTGYQIALAVLAILLIAAIVGIVLLYLKLKDMMMKEDMRRAEDDSRRRRGAQQGQKQVQAGQKRPEGAAQGKAGEVRTGEPKKIMQTVGEERPAGANPAGAAQGQRPAGAGQGQRPAGAAQGQRPAGAAQGQRPAGAGQGQRPAGAAQGQRPAGAGQGQRPAGAAQGQRPVGARPAGAPQGQKPNVPTRPAAKNPIPDDDGEFIFLNGFDEK